MKTTSPLLILECNEDYAVLYFSCYSTHPAVRAFFSATTKDAVKEYFLKEDITPEEILYYFKYTGGEDSEVEFKDLTEMFGGCKILAFIP